MFSYEVLAICLKLKLTWISSTLSGNPPTPGVPETAGLTEVALENLPCH